MSIRAAAAAVSGAAHQRLARNGQDAAASWSDERRGIVVVCDGCGSGARSEFGAIFTANAMVAAMTKRLSAGESALEQATWEAARGEVVAALQQLLASWRHQPGEGGALAEPQATQQATRQATRQATQQATQQAHQIEQHLLCTVVAAACDERGAAIWALGDGAVILDEQLTELGPFADNAPPYLAYDLFGAPRPAHFAASAHPRGTALVATDGAAALGEQLFSVAAHDRYLSHPDALRRFLVTAARSTERIDWSARRVDRTAAPLQDDGAIGLLRWSPDESPDESALPS